MKNLFVQYAVTYTKVMKLLNFARNVNNLVQNSKKLLNQMNLIL